MGVVQTTDYKQPDEWRKTNCAGERQGRNLAYSRAASKDQYKKPICRLKHVVLDGS